ncbi:MAG: serine/threonine protein kinase [Solirubrobacteraceae bacterium]|nr:serine/threonine protein kinase [Solirubrobacteraceae bacterium]
MSGPDTTHVAPGGRIDDFELVEVLADGGTSTTFRARSATLERDVVLKFFRPAAFAGEAAAIEQARRDASAVARLEHPGIAPVFAAGDHAGGLYIASALPTGPTVAERGAARELTPDDAGRLVAEVAEALTHAHAAGVLHRDLRPDCVATSRWGHATLRDFGVTRTSGRTGMLTRAEVMESLRYTAPEVVLGRTAGPAADVYGLGALAVWALTGSPPYQDRPAAEYVLFRTSAAPPGLAFADGRPATGVSDAIARAMALDPDARPTPRVFAAALASAIQALPPEVRTQGVPLIALEPHTGDEVVRTPAAGAPAAAPTDATRVEHRRPVAAPETAAKVPVKWTTYAACVTIVLIVGFAAIGVGRLTAEPPPAAVPVGKFAISPPEAWTPAARGEQVEFTTATGGAATLGVAAGRLPGDPVPADELGTPVPKPEPAVSGKVPLVLYRSSGQLVVARPTTAGTLWARCTGVSDGACAVLVAAAKSPGQPVPGTPDAGVAGALRETLASVQQQSGVALSEMEGGRKERAAAAERLATSLRDAASGLKVDGADPGTATALAAVSKALAAQAAALDDLGDAIDRRSGAADRSARAAARRTAAEMRAALATFKRAGYRVEG